MRREISHLEEKASEKRNKISLLENDILHNQENIERIKGEIQQADSSSQEMDTQIQEKQREILSHKQDIEKKQEECRQCETGLRELEAVSYTHLDVYKRQSMEKCPRCGKTLLKKKGKNPKLYCVTPDCGYEKVEEKKDE